MRGPDIQQEMLLSTVSLEQQEPKDHPLRPFRRMLDEALKALDSEFNALYAYLGRDSIPLEKLLRSQLLMALYTIRSEQLVEQIDYNLLFRWFMGFSMGDRVWHHSTYTKNRDRLLEGEAAHKFFAQVLEQARVAYQLSKEHFRVDGKLIEALASSKSYRPKDEEEPPTQAGGSNPTVDFRGEKRSRDTHESKTDRDALLFRKSKDTTARLSYYMGHLLMGNRHGLVVDARVTQETETAEREATTDRVEALTGTHRVTVGADKNYDTKGFVEAMRGANATPHVAQNDTHRSSVIDGRTSRHAGCRTSQTIRKWIEECFGSLKTIGGLRKSRFVVRDMLDFHFVLGAAAYDLVRMRNLGMVAC